ncbi:MAG: PAS domain-containing protein [Acidobacteria bacterium]|nr:PAS domain-containing protein [Acidobacteriota bacterium]
MTSSAGDPAFATDGSGLIVAWNRAAETLFSVAQERAVGKSCGRIVQGTDESGPG